MIPVEKLIGSNAGAWDEIILTDPTRFRRELAQVASDSNRPWPVRMKAFRILYQRPGILSAFESADVINPCIAAFAREFPKETLLGLAARIAAEDPQSGADGITLLNFATLFETLSPQGCAQYINEIQRSLDGCTIGESLRSILTSKRKRRNNGL